MRKVDLGVQNIKSSKKKWEDKCLEGLYRFFPQVKGLVDFVDIGTPLSIEYYLKKPEGGAVGLDQSPAQYVDWNIVKHLNIATPIQGLYMTGQDVLTCSIGFSQIAGLLTALRVAGVRGSFLFIAYCYRVFLQYLFLRSDSL